MERDAFVVRLGNTSLKYYSLQKAEKEGLVSELSELPYSIRVLAENSLRHWDGRAVTEEQVRAVFRWHESVLAGVDIAFFPARILMQDFTGVPAVVDLASMRDALARRGVPPSVVNPRIPVDLVIDHSVQVDFFGVADAYKLNTELEYNRNRERYQLLKWAQQAFSNMQVIPPGMGIVHQVNLEFLAKVVMEQDGVVFPDTCLGTDSHTPMVNGIGVVAWGVGGIEAEAAMLGEPVYFVLPEVVGLQLVGELREGVTPTDLVLTITRVLREHGVVGKFVEVFGEGVEHLTVPDRATIANMSPEFGCTITYFPIDQQTLDYLRLTGRSEEHVKLVEQYAKENCLWREVTNRVKYSNVVELDLSTVEPCVAGPGRPHDYIPLRELKTRVGTLLSKEESRKATAQAEHRWEAEGGESAVAEKVGKQPLRTIWIESGDGVRVPVSDGSLAIAAITSCTNTSNPFVLVGAALVAKKAVERGLSVRPWIKTSFAPGSRAVVDYLQKAGLLPYLEALRFHVVGFGCTTCIGNSGPLPEPMIRAAQEGIVLASVLSGNRNFEARINPLVRMNFLASPPLVVAFALKGTVYADLLNEPIGYDPNGRPVYLKDIWFSSREVFDIMNQVVEPEVFRRNYQRALEGDELWRSFSAPSGELYEWDESSTYIRRAPFFDGIGDEPQPLEDIRGARVLLLLGDTVTTDHISPAGSIKPDSPAGRYLIACGVELADFNTYGARRGNHEVMIRGTFANVRLKNRLLSREGGYTIYLPTHEEMTVYEAATKYKEDGTHVIIIAGKEYGSGSSRDWAAKGTALLGIRAVIAESFERIHRTNLVCMGVLPLEFIPGQNTHTLQLTGEETYDIIGVSALEPRKKLTVTATRPSGEKLTFEVVARVDTPIEVEYIKHGGILPYIYRQFLRRAASKVS